MGDFSPYILSNISPLSRALFCPLHEPQKNTKYLSISRRGPLWYPSVFCGPFRKMCKNAFIRRIVLLYRITTKGKTTKGH